jgi:hypothetical protein
VRRSRLLLGAALVPVLALGACGDDEADPTAEATAGIAAVVAGRVGVAPTQVAVACPEELVVEAGVEFTCAVTIAEADPIDLDFAVTIEGVVELQRAVVPTADAETYLAGQLAGPAEGAVQVDCGEAPLLVADIGDQLRCDAVRPDGTPHTVVVEILTLDGTVRYQVEPANGATTTTAPPP